MVAPTALALIITTFAEGPPRNRAMGVYAAMSGGGAAVGLVAGGLLTTYLSWRWVLFVNVPIGMLTALGRTVRARRVAARAAGSTCPGAITGTAGVALLVYGLSNAGTDSARRLALGRHQGRRLAGGRGGAAGSFVAHRGAQPARADAAADPRQPQPVRRIPVMLCLATAMFGIFFFLTIFVQDVLGYSALKSGVAFLPVRRDRGHVRASAPQLIARTGARPLMLAAAAITAGGMFWFSRISVHSTYAGGLLGPMLVTAAGLGLLFVPLSLVALTSVRDDDSGLASSLLNTGQQVGGAIGLAALGTVAWTVVANTVRNSANAARAVAAAAARGGHPLHATAAQAKAAQASIFDHALSAGFSRGFQISAGIMVLALIVTAVMMRVTRQDQADA